jgi:hypothetical protein
MSEQGQDRGGGDTRKAWDEVGEKFSEVGHKFGAHYRKLAADVGAVSEERKRALGDAVKDALDELDHAFTALGDGLRDPETKDSLKQAAKSFGDALSTTFSDLADEIRRRTRGKGADPGDSPTTSA